MNNKIKISEIIKWKKKGKRIAMLTAFDYPMAAILDRAGVDIVLVGDSLANVALGLESTKQVDIEIMLHHSKAVRRGVKRACLIVDMPYSSCHQGAARALKDAKCLMKETACDGVKIEWFPGCLPVIKKIIAAKIPVMGHVGLTPQTADRLGGMKVQGKDAKSAKKIFEQALAMEAVGVFSLVLECVPDRLAGLITAKLKIPTIGIGAGALCDGQVVVTYDLLGLVGQFHPKFVKQYAELDREIADAIGQYVVEVRDRAFPGAQHAFAIKDEEWIEVEKSIKGSRGSDI